MNCIWIEEEKGFGSWASFFTPWNYMQVSNADHVLRRIRIGGGGGAESACRKWHLVVDTNCFLDADALKCLKQLEGIRETRIIIPKIGETHSWIPVPPLPWVGGFFNLHFQSTAVAFIHAFSSCFRVSAKKRTFSNVMGNFLFVWFFSGAGAGLLEAQRQCEDGCSVSSQMDRRMYGEDAFLDPCSKLLWDTSSANYPTTFVSLTEQVIGWFTKWS